jgi:hypothetical protein
VPHAVGPRALLGEEAQRQAEARQPVRLCFGGDSFEARQRLDRPVAGEHFPDLGLRPTCHQAGRGQEHDK